MLYDYIRSVVTISTAACNGTLPLKQALHKVPKGLRRGCVRGLDRHSCHGCSAIQQHLRQEPCCRGPSALSMDIHPEGRRHSSRSHGHDIGSCHASAERLQTDSDSVTKPEATGCTLPNHIRMPLPSLRWQMQRCTGTKRAVIQHLQVVGGSCGKGCTAELVLQPAGRLQAAPGGLELCRRHLRPCLQGWRLVWRLRRQTAVSPGQA